MTAILKRGDRIHIAFPVDGNVTSEEAMKQALHRKEELTATYAKQGVTVVRWNAHNALTHPVVVAVFRDEEEGQ